MIQPGGTTEHELQWDAFAMRAETYGADITRWPEVHREAARALIGLDPARAEGILAAERNLDQLLASASARRPLIFVDFAWLRGRLRQPVLSGAAALAVCAGLLVGTAMSGGVLTAARQDALASAVQTDIPTGAEPTSAGPT